MAISSSSSMSIVDYKRPFNVDASSITEYFCSVLASDGRSDRGALRNGNLLFKNHFVHSIAVSRRFIEVTIIAKCRAQMKKAVTYEVKLLINTNRPADIISGCCQCVAGQGPKAACKHIAALYFGLLDYDDKKLYDARTQRLQEWHKPTRRSSNPVALQDIDFGCLRHGMTSQESPQYLTFLKDYTFVPRAETTLQQLLVKYNQESTIAASFFVSEQPSSADSPLPGRVVSQSPVAFDFSTDPSIIQYYYEKIHVSSNEISKIEIATRGQAACAQWFKDRKIRILGKLIFNSSFESNATECVCLHGASGYEMKINSSELIDIIFGYAEEKRKMNICTSTYPSGLLIDQTAPYLCCSPDALVVEVVNNTKSFGILECKYVYADEHATWDSLIAARENFCLEWKDIQLQLRSDHPYYYQLIALLGIIDYAWIDICILKGQDVHIQRLTKNDMVWSKIKQKLTKFYFKYFLPQILKEE
ncbi:unnamed protein product [Adineta ricciae]|uniref:SWIM-type domain-containing protein n=1 Tax=Adineta ricciae TaxID=249248 RepID=A0A815W6N7_ADIRI|nr:unnamed protein product [Adineta ricciae]